MRLTSSTDKEGVRKLSDKGHILESPSDAIKDPYILEFLHLREKHQYSENDWESFLIDKLEYFLLELGKGFTFVARQKRITFSERHFYLDLVFYNRTWTVDSDADQRAIKKGLMDAGSYWQAKKRIIINLVK